LHERDVVIVSACRTPFGKYGGSLKDFDPVKLGAITMKEVLGRVDYKDEVDEIYWGVGDTASFKDVYTPVIARQTLLEAGLAPETPSCSLDKACVSAMSAVQLGQRAIASNEAEIVIAGGVTTFSQMPLVVRGLRFKGNRLGPVPMEDPLFEIGYKDYNPVAVDAGEVALEHGISREEQDEWALRSHELYGKCYQQGKMNEEMINMTIPQKKKEPLEFKKDEQYRENMSMEKLSKLPTIYGSPTCTAGNSPGLNDGATAMLLMTRKKAEELSLEVLGTLVSTVSIAKKPRLLAETPAKAIETALKKSSLVLEDMNLIEINEAFAAVTLVSSKMLADGDTNKTTSIRERTNVNGGAIAIGHPNTASGARIIMTMLYELRRRGGGYGIAAICGGLAQGDAAIIKVE